MYFINFTFSYIMSYNKFLIDENNFEIYLNNLIINDNIK